MNPNLSRNIAKAMQNAREVDMTNAFREATDDEKVAIEALINKIHRFPIEVRSTDTHGNRSAWFDCINQENLMTKLGFSDEARAFFGSKILRLRVGTKLDEGEDARELNLYSFDSALDAPDPLSNGQTYLQSIVASSGIALQEASYNIFPCYQEFRDIEAIVDLFLPKGSQ